MTFLEGAIVGLNLALLRFAVGTRTWILSRARDLHEQGKLAEIVQDLEPPEFYDRHGLPRLARCVEGLRCAVAEGLHRLESSMPLDALELAHYLDFLPDKLNPPPEEGDVLRTRRLAAEVREIRNDITHPGTTDRNKYEKLLVPLLGGTQNSSANRDLWKQVATDIGTLSKLLSLLEAPDTLLRELATLTSPLAAPDWERLCRELRTARQAIYYHAVVWSCMHVYRDGERVEIRHALLREAKGALTDEQTGEIEATVGNDIKGKAIHPVVKNYFDQLGRQLGDLAPGAEFDYDGATKFAVENEVLLRYLNPRESMNDTTLEILEWTETTVCEEDSTTFTTRIKGKNSSRLPVKDIKDSSSTDFELLKNCDLEAWALDDAGNRKGPLSIDARVTGNDVATAVSFSPPLEPYELFHVEWSHIRHEKDDNQDGYVFYTPAERRAATLKVVFLCHFELRQVNVYYRTCDQFIRVFEPRASYVRGANGMKNSWSCNLSLKDFPGHEHLPDIVLIRFFRQR